MPCPTIPWNTLALRCLLLLLLTAESGCIRQGAAPGGTTKTGNQSADKVQGPGIDFARKSIGLPTETLDFSGTAAAALAGAKESGDIFFGDPKSGDLKLFRRNLQSGERSLITEIKQFHDSSLASTPDGKHLVYCRFRELKDVIDDPKVSYPNPLAVPYVFDVAAKTEQRAIDFNLPELRRWRANGVQPFISPDGKTVYILAYDCDRLLLSNQCNEWLARDQRMREQPKDYSPKDKTEDKQLTTDFLQAPDVIARLKAAGVAPESGKGITPAIRAVVKELFDEVALPKAALLVSRDGTTRVLELQFLEPYQAHYHFIAAAGNNTVVIAAQDNDAATIQAEPLYSCDLQTGTLKQFGSVTGLTKLVTLASDEQELLICYTPIDIEKKQMDSLSYLLRVPLDGSAVSQTALGGDYLGVVDLDKSGKRLVGQDANDYGIYVVDTSSGQRQFVSEQLGVLTGLFVSSDGNTLVYLDTGVTYKIDLAGRLDAKPDRITAAYFAPFSAELKQFLGKVGFTLTEGQLEEHWEEREGLGAHELSVQYSPLDQRDKAVMLRYDVERKQVVSLWLPTGYVFPATAELKGSNFDYYDAEKLAKSILDRVGWIPADKRELYQPGPNPLYDQKSDSYVITFRESYPLANSNEKAFCNEATLRIAGKRAELLEMTLTLNDPVQNQPLTIDRQGLPFLVKNLKDQALPDEAPVRVDAEGARLIVFTKREQAEENGKLVGKVSTRLCWEVDTLLQPEEDLVFTNLIDTETGEKLGQLSYMPMAPGATTTER